MTQTNDQDFQQFRGAFDDAMMPDAAFKAKMEKLLHTEQPVEAERTSTVLASPPRQQPQTVVPPARRSSPLMVAVAVLMVFTVAIASVWVLSGDALQSEYASAPSGVATLPADASGMPGEDVLLQPQLLKEVPAETYLIGIYDDVIISRNWVPDASEFGSSNITAIDRTTGKTLWQKNKFDFQQLAHSGQTIVALQWRYEDDATPGIGHQHILALDATSGEILWENDLPEGQYPEFPDDRTTPVIIGDTVAVADTSGTIRGWDLTTGEIRWEQPFDAGEGFPIEMHVGPDEIVQGAYRTVALTSWNNQLVLANGNGLIMEVDPATGTTIRDYRPDSLPLANAPANYVNLESLPNGILLTYVPNTSEGMNANMIAIDPSTGKAVWRQSVEGSFGVGADASGDGTVAWTSHIWEPTNWLLRMFGNHGHSTLQLVWVDGNTGEEILSTERGRVDVVYPVVTDGEYACTQLEQFICFDRSGTRHILDIHPYGEPLLADGVLYYVTQYGLFNVSLP